MTKLEKAIAEMKDVVMAEMLSAANLMNYIEEVENYIQNGDPEYVTTALGSIGMQRRDYVIEKEWYKNKTRELECWNNILKAAKEEKGL